MSRLARIEVAVMEPSVITITHDEAGNVFVDANCELVEALGIIELAKALLIEQAT